MFARLSSLSRPRFSLNLNPGSAGTFSRFAGAPLVRRSARVQHFSSQSPLQKIRYLRIVPKGEQRDPRVVQQQKAAAWSAFQYTLFIIVGGGAIVYVTHLEEVPETGRRRFMITSAKFEEELTESIRAETRAEYAHMTLPPDHPITKHVERIVRRIITANNLGTLVVDNVQNQSKDAGFSSGWGGGEVGAELDSEGKEVGKPYGPGKTWDVIVINDPHTINAAANPGLIMVFTGILPICKDEEGLAGVLSHEIGHVVARHSAERVSSQLVSYALIGVLQLLGIDFFFGNTITNYFLELPNSRAQEMEADTIGLKLLANACYDPAACPRVIERLGSLEGGTPGKFGNFLRTHPSSDIRVQNMERHLPKAYDMLESNPICGSVRKELESFKSNARAVKLGRGGEIVIA